MSKPIDRRIQRTKNAIHEAMLSLMLEKGYEKITVQDIIDRANIGRATFYNHYENKEDLVLRGIAKIPYSPHPTASPPIPQDTGPLSFAASFEHSRQNKRLHQAMYRRSLENPILEKVTAFFFHKIYKNLENAAPTEKTDRDKITILAHFLNGGLLAVIKWWHLNDFPYAAEEMDTLIQQIVLPGIERILSHED